MNYYEILKVPKSASNEQIKSSYKNLVKKYHPDLYVGDKNFAEQKIKEINEAYDVLSDTKKKLEYDAYLTSLSTPTISYTKNVEPNIANNFTRSNPEQTQGFFTKLVLEKINKLDKKRQLQIFILILVLFLSLFLINMIQVQYYLNNQNNKMPSSSNNSNIVENDFTPTYEDKAFYNETDLKTLDDLFYELLSPYFDEEYETNTFDNY